MAGLPDHSWGCSRVEERVQLEVLQVRIDPINDVAGEEVDLVSSAWISSWALKELIAFIGSSSLAWATSSLSTSALQ